MRIRPCVVIPQRQSILLLRYRYGNNDVYGIPGGSPEPDETLKDTLLREAKEELSIRVDIEKLLFIGEILWENKRKSVLNCIFLGKLLQGLPCINTSRTTATDVIWAPVNRLAEMNLYPDIGVKITEAFKNGFKDNSVYVGRIKQRWFK